MTGICDPEVHKTQQRSVEFTTAGGFLYWINDAFEVHLRKGAIFTDTNSVTKVEIGVQNPHSLTTDGNDVYFLGNSVSSTAEIHKLNTDAKTSQLVLGDISTTDTDNLKVSGGVYFWTGRSGSVAALYYAPNANQRIMLVKGSITEYLVRNSTAYYFLDGLLYSIDAPSTYSASDPPKPIAITEVAQQNNPRHLTMTENRIIWYSDSENSPTPAAAGARMLTVQDNGQHEYNNMLFSLNSPTKMLADLDFLYVVESGTIVGGYSYTEKVLHNLGSVGVASNALAITPAGLQDRYVYWADNTTTGPSILRAPVFLKP